MALYPLLERLPFTWIKRSQEAKEAIVEAARDMIARNKGRNAKESNLQGEGGQREERAGGRDAGERDILGCMVEENRRLKEVGEEGLSDDEMIYQILTFLGAG
jgi:cytochrome P450